MGQIFPAPVKGISVRPVDREAGPGAGPGTSGNNSLFLGLNAGQNATSSNLIVLGSGTGAGGIGDSTGPMTGTTIVGVGSASNLVSSGFAGPALPLILYGSQDLLIASRASSTTILGSGLLNGTQAIDQSTVIGAGVYQNVNTAAGGPVGMRLSQVIGNSIMTAPGTTGISGTISSVLIGSQLFTASSPVPSTCVFIGSQIEGGNPGTGVGGVVAIGSLIVLPSNAPSGNVLIGASVQYTGPVNNNPITNNVVIGPSNQYDGNSNIVIGNAANVPTTAVANAPFGNVILGFKAGSSVTAGTSINNLLIIESAINVGAAPSTMFYGNFASGNLIVGNSTQAANRDLPNLTNCLKLLNSTVTAATNPIGGGYFYVLAGALHWKGSAGTDTVVAPA